MSINIPIKDDPNQVIKIPLDQVVYNLKFLYNTLVDGWTMGIFDEEDNPILIDLKIVPNMFAIRDFVNNGLPPGDFVCNVESSIQKINRDSFANGEAQLIYLTEDDIESL